MLWAIFPFPEESIGWHAVFFGGFQGTPTGTPKKKQKETKNRFLFLITILFFGGVPLKKSHTPLAQRSLGVFWLAETDPKDLAASFVAGMAVFGSFAGLGARAKLAGAVCFFSFYSSQFFSPILFSLLLFFLLFPLSFLLLLLLFFRTWGVVSAPGRRAEC